MINNNTATTVAFTGYRPDKIKNSDPNNNFLLPEIQARLLGTIHKLAEQGYRTFLSGMAAGFDLMAANAVLLARNTYPEIELICVVPFPEQASHFEPYWKLEHSNILKQAQKASPYFRNTTVAYIIGEMIFWWSTARCSYATMTVNKAVPNTRYLLQPIRV